MRAFGNKMNDSFRDNKMEVQGKNKLVYSIWLSDKTILYSRDYVNTD